jgi:hypothetical protein
MVRINKKEFDRRIRLRNRPNGGLPGGDMYLRKPGEYWIMTHFHPDANDVCYIVPISSDLYIDSDGNCSLNNGEFYADINQGKWFEDNQVCYICCDEWLNDYRPDLAKEILNCLAKTIRR